jgi:hypothetical protein
MSRENVDLYLRAIDAYNRRDLEAVVELMDENVEAESRFAAIEGGYQRARWNSRLVGKPARGSPGHQHRGDGGPRPWPYDARRCAYAWSRCR